MVHAISEQYSSWLRLRHPLCSTGGVKEDIATLATRASTIIVLACWTVLLQVATSGHVRRALLTTLATRPSVAAMLARSTATFAATVSHSAVSGRREMRFIMCYN